MKNLQYIFILALCLLSIPALRAKEGADQYPFGAENWFAGALPRARLLFHQLCWLLRRSAQGWFGTERQFGWNNTHRSRHF